MQTEAFFSTHAMLIALSICIEKNNFAYKFIYAKKVETTNTCG